MRGVIVAALQVVAASVLAVMLCAAPPLAVHAQPIIPCTGVDCEIGDLFELGANVYNFLMGAAAVVFMIMIVIAGIGMLTYHYFENPDTVLQGAKFTLSRGIAGFVIVAMAYIIVNTVLTLLGVDGAFYFSGGFLET